MVEPPKPKPETPVIETKPPVKATTETIVIKPSKTVVPKKDSQEKKPVVIASQVQVVTSSPKDMIVVAASPAAKPKVIVSSVVQVVEEKAPIVKSKSSKNKPAVVLPEKKTLKKDTKVFAVEPVIVASQVQAIEPIKTVVNDFEQEQRPAIFSSVVEVHSSSSSDDDDPVLAIENNIGEPEYDFLSRQAEYAEESYRVVNLKPSRRTKPADRKTQSQSHPVGLVTKLGETVVNDGLTTVHETSVIGTSISGKYAQILQSTSTVLGGNNNNKIKATPTSSLRILKTAAPKQQQQQSKYEEPEEHVLQVDALYGNSPTPNLVRSSRKPSNPSGSFKNRLTKTKQDEVVEVVQPSSPNIPAYGNGKKASRPRLTSTIQPSKSKR